MHSGKQNHRCKACGRQFVARAAERIMADEQRTLIEHLYFICHYNLTRTTALPV